MAILYRSVRCLTFPQKYFGDGALQGGIAAAARATPMLRRGLVDSGWPRLIFFELISFGTKLVDLVQHSLQQRFRRRCGDAPPFAAVGFHRAVGGLGRASSRFRGGQNQAAWRSRSAKAFSICRRTVVIGRPSCSRSRRRFQRRMISRSLAGVHGRSLGISPNANEKRTKIQDANSWAADGRGC
jgi:hypothetical protein